ncbi:spore coat associated protein CotJA [Neomoorella thermoacetica]|uniref:Spore coat associated protein CotJA n=2 Tax=Neomoorella thermoacetica TaxID=1525 RepID=A0A1D7XB45_NEOTH|nr:spore coat associated protein CotJA [Moorella thermoacetica]AKX94169.1 spore coat associated protein JA (CotJA) [Moorella thermoacetica]AKX96809.1 spore coat associated protein JA (CotJA) [Moorella thermoacetica]AOQ24115.1 Spore coat associated protein JA (CotJA) [Moorella thermoacetica]APC08562.1 spore coat associated protein CotJA [Moorella thermoacetica]OIQ08544.1 spore coat associated protein CotJA [Moorella thermoacetica]
MTADQQGNRGITVRPKDDKVEKQAFAYQLARAYVPWQRFTNRWEPMEGLTRGTIFPELYQPYQPRRTP